MSGALLRLVCVLLVVLGINVAMAGYGRVGFAAAVVAVLLSEFNGQSYYTR